MGKVTTFIVLLSIIVPALAGAQSKKKQIVDSGYAAVNGTKLYYEISGKGEPLILIHGSFGDRRFWSNQFNALAKKFKVICYDVRGFGKSALPDSNEAYTDAADLNALMEFLKIEKAHICGLSLGSIIAIDLALTYPQRCISLIPVGPRVTGDATDQYRSANGDSIREIIATTTTIAKTQGPKAATDFLWKGNHAMGRTVIDPGTLSTLLTMGYEYSWWRYLHTSKRSFAEPLGIKRLSEIKIPTLVVTAEYDLELCKEIAAIMIKQMPNAKLVSIKAAGHLMNMDQPEEFNEVVTNFIKELK
jgi:pimeloyl-ACP methyl ester carboxylesterase